VIVFHFLARTPWVNKSWDCWLPSIDLKSSRVTSIPVAFNFCWNLVSPV